MDTCLGNRDVYLAYCERNVLKSLETLEGTQCSGKLSADWSCFEVYHLGRMHTSWVGMIRKYPGSGASQTGENGLSFIGCWDGLEGLRLEVVLVLGSKWRINARLKTKILHNTH